MEAKRFIHYSANYANERFARLSYRKLLQRLRLRLRSGLCSPEEENIMKRLHVHVAVEDLTASIRFYSQLFAAQPVVHKEDYAKWMLEDPRVNFAISRRGATPGVEHLGIQVEDRAELEEIYGRLKGAQHPVSEEGQTTCCYAKSEKSWIADPQGVQWEAFLTSEESAIYGGDAVRGSQTTAAACKCSPVSVRTVW